MLAKMNSDKNKCHWEIPDAHTLLVVTLKNTNNLEHGLTVSLKSKLATTVAVFTFT